MNKPTDKMTLAVVSAFPPGRGSLNEYAYHLVKALGQKSELAEIVVLVDETAEETVLEVGDTAIPVRIIPCWRFGDWRNPLRILRRLRTIRPDAVLFNIQFASFGGDKISAALGLAAPALARAAGFPTGVLLHNIMETVDLAETGFASRRLTAAIIRFFGSLMTRALLFSDYVAFTIPRYVDIITAKYGADNAILAPHGTFEAPPAADCQPPLRRPRILTFGKFGTYKRVESLIEAVSRVRQRHPAVELVIAGTDSPNTPGYLDDVREKYGEQNWITYTGYVPEADVPGLFQEASMVVFPYTSTTGSSGVLHQAGSYGRAAVLPLIGDLADLIADEGYAGQFFDPEHPASLAAAISSLLEDPARLQRLGRQNYLASRSLLIDDIADWHLLHLERLVSQKRARPAAMPAAARNAA